jgi:hypothetical protein
METNKDQTDESNQAWGKEIQSLGMGELKEGLQALGQKLYTCNVHHHRETTTSRIHIFLRPVPKG